MARLEICLLGGFELSREGRILDPLPLRAARSLFAYLVLNRERAHTRDLLAGTLWPDFDESRARRRLSQALWQIRTTVGDGDDRYLIGTPDTIRFNPDADFVLDVDEFERRLEEATKSESRSEETAALEAAVALYEGDLLAGFYDDWLLHDQDRLRSRFLAALERLTELAQSRGDFEVALVMARRLAQEDEFDEEAHRRVMRLAVLLGRHNEAIRQYEECRRILAEELGSTPSAETIELYEATVADRESGGRPLPVHEESPLFGDTEQSPFVGRDSERSLLAQRLDAVLDGKGGLVLIEGESGVGKTRLLREVVADAHWRGMDVLWGGSSPSGGRPFAPLAEALKGVTGLRAKQLASRLAPVWADVLAPLAPALGDASEPTENPGPIRRADEQSRMREAIAEAFHTLATLGPTLVVLEDVHWADDDTIAALTQIAGRIASDRILFAVSYRHGEARERSDVWELLRALDRMPHCERVSLAPLSPAQTEELIRHSLGRSEVSGDFSEGLHRDTGGIPLFIVETLRALYEKDALDDADAPTETPPPTRDRIPVTPRVHALIRHRLDSLDPLSRRTLELVAAHDGTLLLEEIVDASDLEGQAALASVDDLARRRFLAGREREYSVGHELMRRVVYDDLPLSRRLDLHRRVALGIERHRPDEVEVLAHHFATARMPDRAAEFLEKAALRAMEVHAYDTAALHLDRASLALDDIGAPNERRYSIAALHEEVLDVLGRRTEQEEALLRLQRFASPEQQGDVHRRRAWWLSHQDRFPEAEAEAVKALDEAHAANDPGQIVSALTALGMIACFGGRAAEGVRHLEEAAGFRGTDRRQEADARNALGQNLIDLQRFGEAESQLLAALALYGEMEDRRGQAEVLGMLGTLRMERGEPEAAESDFVKAIDISKQIGYRHGEAVYEMNLAILYVITNRLGSALDSFESAAETYALMGNRRGQALVQSNAAWLWHGLIGDDRRAKELVAGALEVYSDIGDVRGKAQCLALQGSIAGRSGRHSDAERLFETCLDLTREAKDSWLTAQALREYAASQLEAGRLEAALSNATEGERLCREFGMNDLLVGIRALIGRIQLRLGNLEAAETAADRAMREIRPGVELAHLVPLALSEVAEAKGEREEAGRLIDMAYKQLTETLSGLPSEVRAHALESVPANRAIAEGWRERQPDVVLVRLPSNDAPAGRTLTPDDFLQVEWTIHDPSDKDIDDRLERRRRRIVRLIDEAEQQNAAPTVDDLANAIGASSATIRRDLAALRAAGERAATRGSR
ncbi:MAG TPA: AAA family ATPase [Acidimicrobiia bacterium]|nr:AAA family ATPase [Acidimicrobiia bacterium]